jgi:hypothetical protein
MKEAFAPAIAALQADLADLDARAREIKVAINVLCKHAGADELYPNLADANGNRSVASIKADTFYGKPMGTAAREYLEMRKSTGSGPAQSRDIYDALVLGGFQFDTANPTNAQISLGNMLRKNTKMFHRLPNGQYGLLSWYPTAKAQPTKTAADSRPTAASVSSDASLNDQEDDASEPMEEEGNDDLASHPVVTG